ncbi:unnamed protein product [Pleuronectes platessa]|uniref:Uncharacterized protein n=1 Tax=Pleuronectes platessa TaxID=8262 RepID=A0A9N7UWV2_PLEPL|nr:unnamed protein product [Pleuronectes platessa]
MLRLSAWRTGGLARLLHPDPLFAFDSKSHNDIQVLTRLRNEAAEGGERKIESEEEGACTCELLGTRVHVARPVKRSPCFFFLPHTLHCFILSLSALCTSSLVCARFFLPPPPPPPPPPPRCPHAPLLYGFLSFTVKGPVPRGGLGPDPSTGD